MALYYDFPPPDSLYHKTEENLIRKRWEIYHDCVVLNFLGTPLSLYQPNEIKEEMVFEKLQITLRKFMTKKGWHSIKIPKDVLPNDAFINQRLPRWYHDHLYFIEFSSDSSYGRCYPSDLDKYESTFIIDVDTNNKIKNIEMIFDPVYCEMV